MKKRDKIILLLFCFTIIPIFFGGIVIPHLTELDSRVPFDILIGIATTYVFLAIYFAFAFLDLAIRKFKNRNK